MSSARYNELLRVITSGKCIKRSQANISIKHLYGDGEMTKAIVIYHTQFSNTEKIAKALTSGLVEQEVDVDCMNVEDVQVENLVEYDLIAIGGPTHFRTMSKLMKTFLEKLDRVDLKGKNAFAFDTKAQGWWAGSAGKAIEKKLKSIGMRILKPYSSAIITEREGPLQDGMEEQFKQIGAELARLV
jgi:flavorubredoxin